jgi:hypothetical protein
MFISEDLNKILKPKSKQEINKDLQNLSRKDKELLVFNRGINIFEGVFEDLLEFFESFFKDDNNKIWEKVLDKTKKYTNHQTLTLTDIFNNINTDQLIELFLENLTDNQLNYILKEIENWTIKNEI